MSENYKQFVDKLNDYIRKYYFYQLIRGLILFVILGSLYFSVVALLEFFNYFEPGIKLVIVVTTVFLFVIVFFLFVLKPVFRLLGLGKRISYYDVSTRLSSVFPEIKDKLVNILELENEKSSVYSIDLRKASIEQKINELKIYRFNDSIKFSDLKKIFFVFLLVIVGLVITSLEFPEYYKDSSVRLVHFQQKFSKPAPFSFNLEDLKARVVSGETVELKLHCVGKQLPEMMYVNLGGNNFLMKKKDDYYFYSVENLNRSISVFFHDKKYYSDVYKIEVVNKPFISSFDVEVNPPSYTNLNKETLKNIGDLKIASGTNVIWNFRTADADSLVLIFSDSTRVSGKKEGNVFSVERLIKKDIDYKVVVSNSFVKEGSNLTYKIQAIGDLYPEIKVVQVQDSVDFKIFHFKGNIADDYGFHQVGLTVSNGEKDTTFNVPFIPFLTNQDFYYSFDFEGVRNFGSSFKYFFSVYDNDLINHYKKAISETFSFAFPEYKDIIAKENSDQSELELLFQKSSKLTEEIQRDFKNFKLKQINSETTEWDKFQMVKDIMNKKSELENVLDQIKQQNNDANNFLKSFSEEKTDIVKKQQQIDELLKDVFTDELKKLFDEFNELAKQFDPKKFEQLSSGMDNRLDDLSKQLERNLALLKKMKIEQKVQRVIDGLKSLATSEKDAVEQLEGKSDLQQLEKKEEGNKKLVDDLLNDYNSAGELNKELEKPMKLFNFDKEFSGLKDNLDRIIDNAKKGSKKKAANDMGRNVKDINELAFAMQQMISSITMKQNGENIEVLKQILNNLIIISFDQEGLLKKYSSVDFNNPLVNELKTRQREVSGQIAFVKDSIYALGKRSPEIGSVVNKEILNLENSSNSAFDNLESGNIGGSRMYQQYGITAANNLALFLSEALEHIKEQQKNSMPGDGECENPGSKSKPSMKNLKDGQMSIKQQLQKMIDEVKKGNTGQISKSIGQTLAQQEILQQLMREMMNSGGLSPKASEQLKAVDQMLEQSKRDLINKNINGELINRQNLILSKLLDAEKADIERDKDDRRESKTAKDVRNVNPQEYLEFGDKGKHENEGLRRENVKMKSFYDQKYNSFINRLKN
jgi:hypothetical protein